MAQAQICSATMNKHPVTLGGTSQAVAGRTIVEIDEAKFYRKRKYEKLETQRCFTDFYES